MRVRWLLDTHAVIFAVSAPRKLGATARRVIENAGPGELGVTATTIAEIGQLLHDDVMKIEGRPSEVFAPFLARCTQVALSLDAAVRAPALGLPHGDPADRLIVAAALDLSVPLVTRDGNITDSGVVRVVW